MTVVSPEEGDRLQRIEQKLDLLLSELGIKYGGPPKEEWQKLAEGGPALKIDAIKKCRVQRGLSLKEAKETVDRYVEGIQRDAS